jgi:hypothetical protein
MYHKSEMTVAALLIAALTMMTVMQAIQLHNMKVLCYVDGNQEAANTRQNKN